jgi:hypothetical protein
MPDDPAQPARIAVPDRLPWTFQMEYQADVFGSFGSNQPKASRHPGLDDDNSPGLRERQHHPLAPSLDRLNQKALDSGVQLPGASALEQRPIPDLDRPQPTATNRRAEPSNHRFYFR